MPKRKKPVYGVQNQLKDRDRKRRARQKAKATDGPSDEPITDYPVPSGSGYGADAAPPGIFWGRFPWGFL